MILYFKLFIILCLHSLLGAPKKLFKTVMKCKMTGNSLVFLYHPHVKQRNLNTQAKTLLLLLDFFSFFFFFFLSFRGKGVQLQQVTVVIETISNENLDCDRYKMNKAFIYNFFFSTSDNYYCEKPFFFLFFFFLLVVIKWLLSRILMWKGTENSLHANKIKMETVFI